MVTATVRRSARLIAPLAFVGSVTIVALIGSSVTDTAPGGWYATLESPSWQPPGWAFGAVWTALYAAMALAAWLWWREGVDARPTLWWWAAQLLLNLGWSLIFFGWHRPGWALAEIVMLNVAIVGTILVGWQINRSASLLMLPYLGWVSFATALNLAIVRA